MNKTSSDIDTIMAWAKRGGHSVTIKPGDKEEPEILDDVVYVVLDDRDYYGPHFDDIFFNKQHLADHINDKYKHPHEYEVHLYLDKGGEAVRVGSAELVGLT